MRKRGLLGDKEYFKNDVFGSCFGGIKGKKAVISGKMPAPSLPKFVFGKLHCVFGSFLGSC